MPRPYGLGLVTHLTVHTFTALRVSLPRLKLERRNQYFEAKKLHYDLAPQAVGHDSARHCLENGPPTVWNSGSAAETEESCRGPKKVVVQNQDFESPKSELCESLEAGAEHQKLSRAEP